MSEGENRRFTFLCVMLCIVFMACDTEDVSSHSRNSQQKLPSICEKQCKKSVNGTKTAKYCHDGSELEMKHRCCQNVSSSTILGIDLQECDLTREAFASGISNLSQLVIISLEGNPIKKIKPADFNTNTGIKYLSLPPQLHCPGGNGTWQNESTTSEATVCIDELDACIAHNVTCPDNSHCVPEGVDMTYCLCNEGYHGYKCMEKGHFPFLAFGIGISVPTVILCIILWMSQRRYVKSKPKDT